MIPITRLAIGEEEAQAAAEVVRGGWLAQGAKVAQFEEAVARFVGAHQAIAVSSGTAALHLALLAAGVGEGDEVIVPSLSFIASANAVRYCGARPVFAEIDGRTFNLDPQKIEEKFTKRTKAVLVVDQLGLPAEMQQLEAIAKRHGAKIVEDAACALGSVYQGKLIGGQGRLCCFSFHPRKVITTGEGGMITTDDDQVARKLRVWRAQGVNVSAEVRHAASEIVVEHYEELGFNYRMSDVLAAIGLEQMRRLPGLVSARRRLAKNYSSLLKHTVPEVLVPYEPRAEEHSWQSYMVLLDEKAQAEQRNQVLSRMLKKGISARRAVMASHLEPLYRQDQGDSCLPVTEAVASRGIILPLFPQMTEEEQNQVVLALRQALDE